MQTQRNCATLSHGNQEKPKLLFIDYEAHATTLSTRFLIDILSSDFEVIPHFYKDIYKVRLNPALVRTCEYVIYFEFFPGRLNLFFNNTKSLFVPMYDNEWESKWIWRRVALTKMPVISFCEKTTRFIRNQGVDNCLEVSFFPDPRLYVSMEGDPQVIILWERGQVSFETIKKLFNPADIKKVVLLRHSGNDSNAYAPVSDEDMKTYHVEIVNVEFLKREELITLLKPAGTFIAPRIKEGIGMAFLEAIAMRKCVIAHNDATMNEYVKHGENGILFDINNPVEIAMSDIIRIHKNIPDPALYYQRWLQDKAAIIPFVRQTQVATLSFRQSVIYYIYFIFSVFEYAWFHFKQLLLNNRRLNEY